MGKTKGPYHAEFPKDSVVRIRDRVFLEYFVKEWAFHNPLLPEQIAYAGKTAMVANIGVYHGGDELYTLTGIPGIWHEQCLESVY